MPDKLTNDELLKLAGDVLAIESRAVDALRDRLNDDFIAACELCLQTPGRIVVISAARLQQRWRPPVHRRSSCTPQKQAMAIWE